MDRVLAHGSILPTCVFNRASVVAKVAILHKGCCMLGPLTGIRVLDFSIVVQGPQCAAMLADLGADAVKIERRDCGDLARLIPLSFSDRRSAYFYAHNRGKRSVTLDLARPAGVAVALKLIETADVMLSSFRPGVLDRSA